MRSSATAEDLPDAARRELAAVGNDLELSDGTEPEALLDADPGLDDDGDVLRGVGASTGTVTGPVRVVLGTRGRVAPAR